MRTEKRCPRCTSTLPASAFRAIKSRPDGLSAYCRPCLSAIQQAHHAKNPSTRREYARRYYAADPERGRALAAKNRQELRLAALRHYGGTPPCCACCGERHVEFLAIDHLANNGGAHRKELGGGSIQVLRWLRDNGYPDGFQVLCHNCNIAKSCYGYCPHQRA